MIAGFIAMMLWGTEKLNAVLNKKDYKKVKKVILQPSNYLRSEKG